MVDLRKVVTVPINNRARRSLTLSMWPTPLPLRQTVHRASWKVNRHTIQSNVNVNVNLYSALSHSASGALNAPHNAETSVFNYWRPKLAMLSSGSRRPLLSAFHTIGPTTENARWLYVSSCILGTTSRRRLAERRCCRSATCATGVHSSDR